MLAQLIVKVVILIELWLMENVFLEMGLIISKTFTLILLFPQMISGSLLMSQS